MNRALAGAGAVVLVALAAVACGDGGSTDPADTTTTAAQSRPAPTEAEARAALLATTDLPGGWKADDSSPDEADDAPCPEFKALDDHKSAVAVEASFAPGQQGPLVEHQVLVFTDATGAEGYMALAEQAVEACKSFTQDDPAMGRFTGSFTVSAEPRLGDDSLAASLSARAPGLDMSGEIVAVRRGRAVSLLSQIAVKVANFGGGQLQGDLTRNLAAKAAAKLEAVA